MQIDFVQRRAAIEAWLHLCHCHEQQFVMRPDICTLDFAASVAGPSVACLDPKNQVLQRTAENRDSVHKRASLVPLEQELRITEYCAEHMHGARQAKTTLWFELISARYKIREQRNLRTSAVNSLCLFLMRERKKVTSNALESYRQRSHFGHTRAHELAPTSHGCAAMIRLARFATLSGIVY